MALNNDGLEAGGLVSERDQAKYLLDQRLAKRKEMLDKSVVAVQEKEVKAK